MQSTSEPFRDEIMPHYGPRFAFNQNEASRLRLRRPHRIRTNRLSCVNADLIASIICSPSSCDNTHFVPERAIFLASVSWPPDSATTDRMASGSSSSVGLQSGPTILLLAHGLSGVTSRVRRCYCGIQTHDRPDPTAVMSAPAGTLTVKSP
jgi:hypothetical protein